MYTYVYTYILLLSVAFTVPVLLVSVVTLLATADTEVKYAIMVPYVLT